MKPISSLFVLIFSSLNVLAQTGEVQSLEGRFWKGSLAGVNEFRTDVNVTQGQQTVFSHSESHYVYFNLGYGWFYKNKKSFAFNAGFGAGLFKTNSYKNWSNQYHAGITKTGYRNLYRNKLFAYVAQDLAYVYSTGRTYETTGQPRNNPTYINHELGFFVNPGLLYRFSKRFNAGVNLRALGITIDQTRYSGDTRKITNVSYGILSNLNVASIQFTAIWLPDFLQSKPRL